MTRYIFSEGKTRVEDASKLTSKTPKHVLSNAILLIVDSADRYNGQVAVDNEDKDHEKQSGAGK